MWVRLPFGGQVTDLADGSEIRAENGQIGIAVPACGARHFLVKAQG